MKDYMNTNEVQQDIDSLKSALHQVEANAAREGRDLNPIEADLKKEIFDHISELQDHKAKMETLDGPVTLERNGPIKSRFGEVGSSINARSYRGMFNLGAHERLGTGGFRDVGEFIRVIDSGRYDPRLIVDDAQTIGVPSAGGFSVPTQYASEWLDASLPNEIVRNLARVTGMTSEEKQVPGWDGADMSGGATHGGLEMEFLAESAEGTKQTAKLRKITLHARTAAIYVDASIELIQDGKDFAENLQKALIQSIGFGIDRFCIGGTGAGQPLGILNAGCKIQVAKETGQSADSIYYGNLKKMFARQLNPDRAVWLFNNTAIPELLEQSVAVGIGGSHVPLLNESNGKFSIFGRPCYFTPHMPTLGDADDCAFVDFNFYALGLRKDVWIDTTDAHRWVQRERSYRVLLRFDGMPTLNTAITPIHGDTLSPIVTLAERAAA